MTNEEILEQLMSRSGDIKTAENESVNAHQCVEYLPQWDASEPFPVENIERYIRMNEWTYEDFCYETELVIGRHLPKFCLDMFFEVKDFRRNSRNELTSSQEAFARLMGLPYNTQDEKALCVYKFAISRFYNNSELEGECDE